MQTLPSRTRRARVPVTLFAALLAGCASTPESPSATEAKSTAEVREILVTGVDYNFAMPPSFPAGPVRIAFENRGKVRHELLLIRLKSGVTLKEFLEVQQTAPEPVHLTDAAGGVLFAEPGERSWGRLAVELESGRTYVLICNFTDGEGQPMHHEMGMISGFTVR